MNDDPRVRWQEALAEREAGGLRRALTPRAADAPWLDLSNNDYLRLSQHPAVIEAGREALARWGASSSASPLISGYTDEHAALEERLARWTGFACGLVWNTGYSANQAVLSLLPQKDDVVLADRLIHNSMVNGILRSGARLRRYRHLDLGHLESMLRAEQGKGGAVFVVTESVFSMDGDAPDLAAFAQLKARYGFVWILDEAHAVGWHGQRGSGLAEQAGVAEAVDIFVGTLGKGLGAMGAYTLFQENLWRNVLINFGSEFIYSTYLSPACAASARAAVDVAESLAAERPGWHELSRAWRTAIPGAPQGDSPIVPVVIGEAADAVHVAGKLREAGFLVGAVRPPTVPAGTARLRISLNRELGEADSARFFSALEEARR